MPKIKMWSADRSIRTGVLFSFVSVSSLSPAWGQVEMTQDHQQEFVRAHNKWRAEPGVPPLKWAADLSKSASEWAMVLGGDMNCKMQHSKNRRDIGENLYWASPIRWSSGRREVQSVSPEQIVDSWGQENADYDYGTNKCRPGKMCGHYTQVVWKNTREVGCAGYVCGNEEQIWVCQYRPAGNYVGQRPY